jgi:hypothetical protein
LFRSRIVKSNEYHKLGIVTGVENKAKTHIAIAILATFSSPTQQNRPLAVMARGRSASDLYGAKKIFQQNQNCLAMPE